MGKQVWLLATFCIVWNFAASSSGFTVEQKLHDDPDLSEFYRLLTTFPVSNFTLFNRQVTIFAPTNAAFQRYSGRQDESLVLYHMINQPTTVDKLGTSLSTDLEGNPPLWVTQRKSLNYDDIYINNAKLLLSKSNYVAMNNNKKQVLHVVDEVLTPVLSSQSTNSPLYNPNAYEFLFQSESVELGPHRLRVFRQKVNQTGKENIFNNDGRYTFFIPVDEGFKPNQRADMLDDKVIDGHVIASHVLFTAPVVHDQQYETLAFGDNLKVTVEFTTEPDANAGKNTKVYVSSNTHVGDSKHTLGVVTAEIVKANIPVKNGVIHLIQKPLMIVDMKIAQVFEMMKENGPLFKFYEIMQDSEVGRNFFNSLQRLQQATVFAPSNLAWQDDNLKNILRDNDKMREILNIHLVKDHRLSVDKIRQNNQNQISTAADRRTLYFNILNKDNEQILTVEGGGVNATVIQADIAATDGIIHIIDKVLGVPHTTVLEKLENDPMLHDTFVLGNRLKFNNQLNDTTKKFTYFVPRDKAWRKTEVTMPSTLKKLFMPDFSYHTTQILERHLVIGDIPYTMERMKQLASESPNNEIELPAVRDTFKIRIEEKEKSFTIIWRNEKIHVFRPDVECTNGVIHVIESPLLQEGDVRVTANSGITVTLTAHCFMLFAIKWLLH